MCLGVMRIGDVLTYPHQINSNDEKRITKEGNVIICWCVMFEKDAKTYCLIVDVVSHMHCCELCIIMKMVIFSYMKDVICIGFETCCDKRYMIRGCTISRDISRATMDTIYRGMYLEL